MTITKGEKAIQKKIAQLKLALHESDLMVASQQITEEQAVEEAKKTLAILGLTFEAIVVLAQDRNYHIPGYWIARRLRNNWEN
jgi:hypothetical protein